jgi:hypothetical protein
MAAASVTVDRGDFDTLTKQVQANPPDGDIVMPNDDAGGFIAEWDSGGTHCKFGASTSHSLA